MTTHTTHHVLITGSYYATREMLDRARRAVQRAEAKGCTVLVGDNPKGIDRAVVQECRRLKAKVIVAGIGNFPRDNGCKHGSYVKVERDVYRVMGGSLLRGFTVRDRWMIDQCQTALFIWNGDDPETKHSYEYAVARGKDAHLVNFDRSPQPHG